MKSMHAILDLNPGIRNCYAVLCVYRAMKMSEAIYDMHAYTRLTDCVLHQILLSTEPELEEVSQILRVFF